MKLLARWRLHAIVVFALLTGVFPFTSTLVSAAGPVVSREVGFQLSLNHLAVNPTTDRVYITTKHELYANYLYALRGDTLATIQQVEVGYGPIGLAVNPTTNRVYLGLSSTNTIQVRDGDTLAIINRVTLAHMGYIEVNPSTNRVYVTNGAGNAVTVLDGTTLAVLGTVPVGARPWRIAVNPSTNRVYVTNLNGASVSVIDGAVDSVIATILVGREPYGIGVNPATNRVYVANFYDNTAMVLDGDSNTVIATLGSGQAAPHDIGVNPTTNNIYVTNSALNRVSIINGAANTINPNALTVGSCPRELGVNPSTNRVYVGNVCGSTISVIADVPLPPPPAPQISLDTTTLTFSEQPVGTTSARQTVKLANSGNASLSISGITPSGDFDRTHDCPSTLPAGAFCTIQVTFRPTTTGTHTGTLAITYNAAGSPHIVALAGTGIAPPPTYALALSATVGGTASASPIPGPYTAGRIVTLTATPSPGYRFVDWTVNGVSGGTTNPLALTMNVNHSVVANFTPITYMLDLSATSGGSAKATPGLGPYDAGTAVTVEAMAATSYRFLGWTVDGQAMAGTETSLTLTMDREHTVVARFVATYTLALSATPGGTASAALSTNPHDAGTIVTLTATASSGYRFTGWTVDGTSGGSANPLALTMNANHTVVANFVATHTLTLSATEGGTVSASPGTEPYAAGTTVVVTATAAAGYRFVGWTLDGQKVAGTDTSLVLTMDRDHAVAATFVRTYILDLSTTPGGAAGAAPGGGSYGAGTTVTVTATAAPGYRFLGWTVDGADAGNDTSLALTMDRDHTVVARFVATYTLELSATAGGTTSSLPATNPHDAGTIVTLTATASSGYRFTGWTVDGADQGGANPLALTMNANHTVVANFAPKPARQQLAELRALLASFNLPKGMANALSVKLEHAQAALEADDIPRTCDQLDTFSNQVRAQEGKALTPEQTAQLLDAVAVLKTTLGCP